jgi:UDP-N-acetylmuramate dehydrogenase
VRKLHQLGLSGTEFLALIPGTFGGSLIMNAGTKRGEIGSIVERVKMVMPDGTLKIVDAEEAQFSYRHSRFPKDAILVEGQLRVRSCGGEMGADIVRQERDYRNQTQPYHQPCAGSVFRNPPGDYSGRLIEAAGLKGMRRGKAQISSMHANFIVTEEGASGRDILALMAIMRRAVQDTFDVTLEPEQRLLGYESDSLGALLDKIAAEDIP